MRRLVVSLVMLALAIVPSRALANTQDVAATHQAIVAGYALARASMTTIKIAQSKIESFNRKLAAECPGVGSGTPEDEASQPMSYEVAVALWSIGYGAAAGPIKAFAKAMRTLHWTSARANRIVHTLVANLTGLATIPLPDLCGDLRTWTASDFTTIPAHVAELDHRVERLEIPEVPWSLVTPYVAKGDQGLVAYIKRAERKLAEFEFMVGQNDWLQVLQTLGLPE